MKRNKTTDQVLELSTKAALCVAIAGTAMTACGSNGADTPADESENAAPQPGADATSAASVEHPEPKRRFTIDPSSLSIHFRAEPAASPPPKGGTPGQ